MRLVLTISLSVLLSSAALPCSCVSSGGCPGLGTKTGPVFLGTVLSVSELNRTSEFVFLSSRKARIRVDESFGGLSPDEHEVDVLTGSGGGDCGIPFNVGDVYLIDSFIGKDGLAHAGICSSTHRVDGADVDLQILRLRRDDKQVPSLTGQVAQTDRNFDGVLGMRDPKPLANMTVRLKADRSVYETQADNHGVYAFYGLPSGKYEFAPDLPPATTLSWFIGSDRRLAPFELHFGACQLRNIDVFASGSIQGRMRDESGKPLRSAFAYIVPASEVVLPKQRKLYWEYQGKEDSFKFVHIPPGEYLIVANPDDSLDPEFPYRRTFYPGVHDRASAAIITIRGGEQVTDADIRLERQFAPRHLTARVTWADGRLIKDFVFVSAKGTVNPDVASHASQPDLKTSAVDLSLMPNESYEVEAELTCRYADERSVGPGATLKSNKAHVVAGDNQTKLFLTIPAAACPEVPGKTLLTDR